MIAARTAAVCVGTAETVAVIRERGLTLVHDGVATETRPEAVERLEEPVALLVIAVKAHQLPQALERIEAFSVAEGVVLPLLNGLEHPAVIRHRLGPRVAPATVSRFSGEVVGPARVLQRSASALVTASSGDVTREELERAVVPLRAGGIEVVVGGDERAVLWDKLARLAPLAAVTSASGLSVGELRDDSGWRNRLGVALEEGCRVAAADGVETDPAAHWAIIDAMPSEATTSTARDVAAGRPSELDAIVGSVLRAAQRLGVATPTLAGLMAEAGAK